MATRQRHSGIQSRTLLDLVENTAPFLFDDPREQPLKEDLAYLRILKSAKANPPDESDLLAYFDLCLSSHYATVGTFVPTDVDLAIREKLWAGVRDESSFSALWKRVEHSFSWDERPVSMRWVGEGEKKLSGHQGEWLTVAMGAYATALRIHSPLLQEIREQIECEVIREEKALHHLRERLLQDQNPVHMKEFLAGVAAVAHNLGDLDRMFDAHSIGDTDVLKRRVYRSAHSDSRNRRPSFLEAGRIYQEFIASENHRNFALRVPKGLRRSSRFLLPFGLFLDDWGGGLVGEGFQTGILTEGDLREIIEALVSGWIRLNPKSIYTSQGYSRALVGMSKALGGKETLVSILPGTVKKNLEESGLRTLMGVPKEIFEKKFQIRLMQVLA